MLYGIHTSALVDSGCTRSIMCEELFARCAAQYSTSAIPTTSEVGLIRMLDNSTMEYSKTAIIDLVVNKQQFALSVILVPCIASQLQLILGMDAIAAVGGICITPSGAAYVRNVESSCGASCELVTDGTGITSGEKDVVIEDDDFVARFDGNQQRWTVCWKWAAEPPTYLSNKIGQYKIADAEKEAFDAEVAEWIANGYLQRYDGNPEDVKGVIPLMSVIQRNKNKVRPVLDYRELNMFLSSHTGDSVVCADKLRQWRRFGSNLAMLDLRRAYLQVFVEPALQMYQAVKYNGRTYLMTRMAFGLSVAPKIMTAIVSKILRMEEHTSVGADSYIDDILVDEDVVSAEHVEELLKKFGLTTKPVERLCKDGIRALGLRVYDDGTGKLKWKRDCNISELDDTELTRRKVFSICGRLVGHFPVAAWLRVACNFIKRQTGRQSWDAEVPPHVAMWVRQLLKRVAEKDLVGREWTVPKTTSGEVWTDASGLAYMGHV